MIFAKPRMCQRLARPGSSTQSHQHGQQHAGPADHSPGPCHRRKPRHAQHCQGVLACKTGRAQSKRFIQIAARRRLVRHGHGMRTGYAARMNTLALHGDAVEHMLLLGRGLHQDEGICAVSRRRSSGRRGNHKRSLMSRQSWASSLRVNAKPLPARCATDTRVASVGAGGKEGSGRAPGVRG